MLLIHAGFVSLNPQSNAMIKPAMKKTKQKKREKKKDQAAEAQ